MIVTLLLRETEDQKEGFCVVSIKDAKVHFVVPKNILTPAQNKHLVFFFSEALGDNDFEMTCVQTGEKIRATRHSFPNLWRAGDFIKSLRQSAYHFYSPVDYFNEVPGGLGIPSKQSV